LLNFLETTLTTDGSLASSGSPQNKAFLQLQSTNPELNPTSVADQGTIIQKYVLNTLYYSTNLVGLTWTLEDLWTTAAPVCGPNDSNWFGVECDQNGDVISLNLAANSLEGTLPSELQGLSTLGKCDTICIFSH
jgi:hypothetical protein